MTALVRDGPSSRSDPGGFQYPFAPSPDIIRAHQKDAYFQGVLLERLSEVLRNLYGARFAHNWTTETRTFTELLYLGLTTFVGNRTLGEEYCDIVHVEDKTRRLPSVVRRSSYILLSVLAPYGLNRILPSIRRRLRSQLESSLRQRNGQQTSKTPSSISSSITTLQQYTLNNLDTLTSPSPIYALSLAAFYFSGAYYHLGKRLAGLRYIYTTQLQPSDQRVGYEVLGVLLTLQLAVQAIIHAQSTYTANAASLASGSAVIPGSGVEVSLDPNAYSANNALLFESAPGTNPAQTEDKIRRITHTDAPEPRGKAGVSDSDDQNIRYRLDDTDTMQWIAGSQQRKCTLCLEPMRDPSATTCGHVFCWTCICDWAREKPECPLCRQSVLVQHILPLRS